MKINIKTPFSFISTYASGIKSIIKNYERNIQRALLGKKIAPAYLDYYLLLGRNYDFLKNTDSARYYYKYYIEKNVANEDAFNYLINLELEDKKYKEADLGGRFDCA